MVEQNETHLSDILKAASDPTRRALLTLLAQEGATRVTDLGACFDMSLNSVSKHIKVLESAGLVLRKTHGRTHLIEANMEPVREIDLWFSQLRSIWDMRLEALDNILTKETAMNDLSLTTTRTINAPARQIFDAWLDPKMLARFMMPGPGMSVPSSETDPVEGGRYAVIMRAGEQDIPHSGTYLKIDRHSHLSFTWESPMSTDGSTVSLDFVENGNSTDVTLTHVKFVSEESRDNHLGGWDNILASLDAALSKSK